MLVYRGGQQGLQTKWIVLVANKETFETWFRHSIEEVLLWTERINWQLRVSSFRSATKGKAKVGYAGLPHLETMKLAFPVETLRRSSCRIRWLVSGSGFQDGETKKLEA